jgi:hypothetical protein
MFFEYIYEFKNYEILGELARRNPYKFQSVLCGSEKFFSCNHFMMISGSLIMCSADP